MPNTQYPGLMHACLGTGKAKRAAKPDSGSLHRETTETTFWTFLHVWFNLAELRLEHGEVRTTMRAAQNSWGSYSAERGSWENDIQFSGVKNTRKSCSKFCSCKKLQVNDKHLPSDKEGLKWSSVMHKLHSVIVGTGLFALRHVVPLLSKG